VHTYRHTQTHTHHKTEHVSKVTLGPNRKSRIQTQNFDFEPYSYQIDSIAFNMDFDVDVSVVNFTGY
jgi:hypothetical protein